MAFDNVTIKMVGKKNDYTLSISIKIRISLNEQLGLYVCLFNIVSFAGLVA